METPKPQIKQEYIFKNIMKMLKHGVIKNNYDSFLNCLVSSCPMWVWQVAAWSTTSFLEIIGPSSSFPTADGGRGSRSLIACQTNKTYKTQWRVLSRCLYGYAKVRAASLVFWFLLLHQSCRSNPNHSLSPLRRGFDLDSLAASCLFRMMPRLWLLRNLTPRG